MASVVFSLEFETFPGVAKESQGAEQGSSGGFRGEGEECWIRTVNAEGELREAWGKNESLMTTLSEYKVRVRNFEKRLEEEELNRMVVLPGQNVQK